MAGLPTPGRAPPRPQTARSTSLLAELGSWWKAFLEGWGGEGPSETEVFRQRTGHRRGPRLQATPSPAAVCPALAPAKRAPREGVGHSASRKLLQQAGNGSGAGKGKRRDQAGGQCPPTAAQPLPYNLCLSLSVRLGQVGFLLVLSFHSHEKLHWEGRESCVNIRDQDSCGRAQEEVCFP